jgi:hypothetical protein
VSADVRGFYAALEIELPAPAQGNASVRCFADPQAHAHEDRHPSCSVSLDHGAWQCWACGAHGGSYDAALARGHAPASAMQLLRRYGLAEPNPAGTAGDHAGQRASQSSGATRPSLSVTELDVAAWATALRGGVGGRLRQRLGRDRLWSSQTIRELEIGHDGTRITIPIRDAHGRLRGVLRYLPGGNPKMLAVPGSRLGLIPHPATEPSRRILIVEGPPDMIAARSRQWPAIAVPGDHAWKPPWARLFAGHEIVVAMDSDPAGRAAAKRIARDLDAACDVRIVDLAPGRDDGFDLTDWLLQRHTQRRPTWRTSSLSRPTLKR